MAASKGTRWTLQHGGSDVILSSGVPLRDNPFAGVQRGPPWEAREREAQRQQTRTGRARVFVDVSP